METKHGAVDRIDALYFLYPQVTSGESEKTVTATPLRTAPHSRLVRESGCTQAAALKTGDSKLCILFTNQLVVYIAGFTSTREVFEMFR